MKLDHSNMTIHVHHHFALLLSSPSTTTVRLGNVYTFQPMQFQALQVLSLKVGGPENIASPQPVTETILTISKLHISLNSTIELISAIIALAALMYLAYQSHLSSKAREVAALHMRYQMILETNKFIFENPEYVPRAVGPKRYEQVKGMTNEDRKSFAAWELLLDNFEFYFLVSFHENKKHGERFLRILLKNPEIMAFMKSALRGTFRSTFEKVVEEEITSSSEQIAPKDHEKVTQTVDSKKTEKSVKPNEKTPV